jgi:hypothetical protein
MATKAPRTTAPQPQTKETIREAEKGALPNAIDINADDLEAPVLTAQGWVVPPDRTKEELAAFKASLKA